MFVSLSDIRQLLNDASCFLANVREVEYEEPTLQPREQGVGHRLSWGRRLARAFLPVLVGMLIDFIRLVLIFGPLSRAQPLAGRMLGAAIMCAFARALGLHWVLTTGWSLLGIMSAPLPIGLFLGGFMGMRKERQYKEQLMRGRLLSSHLTRVFSFLFSVAPVALFCGFSILVVARCVGVHTAELICVITATSATGCLAARTLRYAVGFKTIVAEPEGLVVSGLFRTVHVPYSDVASVEPVWTLCLGGIPVRKIVLRRACRFGSELLFVPRLCHSEAQRLNTGG